jgi:acyl-CoA synthetase (AMP-forming)/AMP-acid ligase II
VDFLFDRFATAPEAIAFNDRGRTFTYGQIIDTTAMFERRLRDVGVSPGDVVIVLGD